MNEPAKGASGDEFALHDRLSSGEPTASAEAAERFLEPLTNRLLRSRRDIRDPQLVEQAVIDAVFSYIMRPQQYDPGRSSLEGYLYRSAVGDLKNELARDRRHSLRAVSIDGGPPAVELSLVDRNTSVEEEALDRLGAGLPAGLDRAAALQLIGQELPDPGDRRLLQLMLDGERRTAVYSGELGIMTRPPGEQRNIVKRHKDRIKVRLRRLRARLQIGDGADDGTGV